MVAMTLLSDSIRVLSSLKEHGLKMAVAESCTGGMIGATVTSVPGSSEVFLGSAAVYSNEAKERILKVSHDTLVRYGAVSEITAKEMVEGAMELFRSDVAVAVTGIAGPGGATPDKPVGLVFIAVSNDVKTVVTRNHFNGDREAIRNQAVHTALYLLHHLIEGKI